MLKLVFLNILFFSFNAFTFQWDPGHYQAKYKSFIFEDGGNQKLEEIISDLYVGKNGEMAGHDFFGVTGGANFLRSWDYNSKNKEVVITHGPNKNPAYKGHCISNTCTLYSVDKENGRSGSIKVYVKIENEIRVTSIIFYNGVLSKANQYTYRPVE